MSDFTIGPTGPDGPTGPSGSMSPTGPTGPGGVLWFDYDTHQFVPVRPDNWKEQIQKIADSAVDSITLHK